jgi:hypothetical protein
MINERPAFEGEQPHHPLFQMHDRGHAAMDRLKRLLLALWFGFLAMAAAHSGAEAMRCDGRLVTVGDRRFDVLAACGEPDLRVPVRLEVIGVYALPYEEIWYYNFGPSRFIQQLRFRQGRLESIDSAGYGFHPDAPGSCRPEDLRRDMTHLELVARCGEPVDREQRLRWLPYDQGYPFARGRAVFEEEWIYDFGPDRFYRILTLVDGLVVKIETGRWGFDRQ